MKTKVFIPIIGFILSSACLFGQGAEIANDLRNYIEAKVKIVEREDGKGYSYVSEKPVKIGGQQVNDETSTVYKAFALHPEWEDVMLVADWTGSMYPYVGQIIRWHKNNMDRNIIKSIVLFNDGDDKIRYGTKKIGQTGGIYYADPNNIDNLLTTVEKAIDNGQGGDSQENDVEAILAGISKYRFQKDIVLVADHTPIRDIELLYKITKPVHVILCNTGNVMDYVKLAYYTGGSITSVNDEIDFSNSQNIDPHNIVLEGMTYDLGSEIANYNQQ